MQRFGSKVMVYAVAVLLLAVILVLCVYVTKTSSEFHPAIIFSVGGGLYTIIVLYLLHRRAGTLGATPEERRSRGRSEEAEPDPL